MQYLRACLFKLLSACRLPGIISSLALVLMNLVSRDDLAAMQDYYSGEDHAEVRSVFCPH